MPSNHKLVCAYPTCPSREGVTDGDIKDLTKGVKLCTACGLPQGTCVRAGAAH